jgi:hypothetical protein
VGDQERGVEVALLDVIEELRDVALAVLLGCAQAFGDAVDGDDEAGAPSACSVRWGMPASI